MYNIYTYIYIYLYIYIYIHTFFCFLLLKTQTSPLFRGPNLFSARATSTPDAPVSLSRDARDLYDFLMSTKTDNSPNNPLPCSSWKLKMVILYRSGVKNHNLHCLSFGMFVKPFLSRFCSKSHSKIKPKSFVGTDVELKLMFPWR